MTPIALESGPTRQVTTCAPVAPDVAWIAGRYQLMVTPMGPEPREVVLSEVSGLAQVRVPVPSLVRLDLGASIDVACRLYDGAFIGLPPGARVALQAGRFEWQVDAEHALPVTLVFVLGARRVVVEVTS